MGDSGVEILEVVIVLKSEYAERFAPTVEHLQSLGLRIESKDEGNGVVEGTLPADKLAAVRGHPCVSYARVDFEYIAEPPSGVAEPDETGHEQTD